MGRISRIGASNGAPPDGSVRRVPASLASTARAFAVRNGLIAKPADTLRVAVVGDSFTEAPQVAYEQTFCAVAERALGGCEGWVPEKSR